MDVCLKLKKSSRRSDNAITRKKADRGRGKESGWGRVERWVNRETTGVGEIFMHGL